MWCLLPSVVGLENPITGDANQDYPLLMNVSVPLSYFISHLLLLFTSLDSGLYITLCLMVRLCVDLFYLLFTRRAVREGGVLNIIIYSLRYIVTLYLTIFYT